MKHKLSSWLTRTAVFGMVAAGCGPGGIVSEFEPVSNGPNSSSSDVLQQSDTLGADILEDVILHEVNHNLSIDASVENETSQSLINLYSPQKPSLKNIAPIINNLEVNCETNADCPEGAVCDGGLCMSYSSSAFSLEEIKTDTLCYSNKDCWSALGSNNSFCKDNYCALLTSSSTEEGICGEFIDNIWNFESGNDQWEYMGYLLPDTGMVLPTCEIYHYSCNTISLSQEDPTSMLDYFCGSALDEIASVVLTIAKKLNPWGALVGFGCLTYNLFSTAEKEEKKEDLQKVSNEFGKYVNFEESEVLKCDLKCYECEEEYTNFCLTLDGKNELKSKGSAYCTYPARIVMENDAPGISGHDVLNDSATDKDYTADIYVSVSDSSWDVYKSYPPEMLCKWKDKAKENGKTVIYELGTYNCDEKLTYSTTKKGVHQLAITPTDPGALVFTFFDVYGEEGIGVNEPDYHKTPSLKWDGSKKESGSPGYVTLEAKFSTVSCPNNCELDAITCFGAGYVICQYVDGCLEWGNLQLCPDGTSCQSQSGKCEADAPVCTSNEYTCNNGGCISLEWICDGITGCSEGEDEEGCGTYSCTDINTCVVGCGGDNACSQACFNQGSLSAKEEHDNLDACYNNFCSEFSYYSFPVSHLVCLYENCKEQYVGCFGLIETGVNTCADVWDCVYNCSSDSNCQWNCLHQGTYAAQINFLKMAACNEVNCKELSGDELDACATNNCMSEISKCM